MFGCLWPNQLYTVVKLAVDTIIISSKRLVFDTRSEISDITALNAAAGPVRTVHRRLLPTLIDLP